MYVPTTKRDRIRSDAPIARPNNPVEKARAYILIRAGVIGEPPLARKVAVDCAELTAKSLCESTTHTICGYNVVGTGKMLGPKLNSIAWEST